MGPARFIVAFAAAHYCADAEAQEPVFAGNGLIEFVPAGEVVGDGVTPATLRVLALKPDGTPMLGLKPRITANAGDLTAWTEQGAGLYSATFVPPLVDAAKTIDVHLRAKGDGRIPIEVDAPVHVVPPIPKSVTMTSNPDHLILGTDPEATLSFQIQGGTARVGDLEVTVSSGEIANVTDMGGGRFTARFVAPKVNYPHLALVTVSDKRDPTRTFGTLVVPLYGKTDYPVKAPPSSAVILRIGGRDFGPVTARADGQALVPVMVPPGQTSATLVTVANGVTDEESIDLRIPETRRLRLVGVPAAVPADPTLSIPIRAVVRRGDGTPDPDARPVFTASIGAFGSVRHEGDGVYVSDWTPPAGQGTASGQVSVALGTGNIQVDAREVRVVPARAARIDLSSEPLTLGPDTTAFKVFVKVVGPSQSGLSGRDLAFIAAGAKLKAPPTDLRNGDYRADFVTTGGPVELLATVDTQGTSAPVRRVLLLPGRDVVVNDGKSQLPIVVVSVDRFGQPVPNTSIVLTEDGDGAMQTLVTTDANGVAQVMYVAGTQPSFVSITASAGDVLGACGVVQAPASVVAEVPVSGSEAYIALAQSYATGVARIRIEREGASGPTLFADAPVASTLSSLQVKPESATVAPGGNVVLLVKAIDSAGHGLPRLTFETLASAGRFGAWTDDGAGNYRVTLSIPADASGEIKVTIASMDGATSSFLKVPVSGAPVKVTPTDVVAPKVVEPAVVEPKAVEPAVVVPKVVEPKVVVPKEPAEPSDVPWLRVQASYTPAIYRYAQRPNASPGPLLPEPLLVGGDAGAPAFPQGFELRARGFVEKLPYLGFDGGVRVSYYGITAPEFNGQVASDFLVDVGADVVGRYPFEVGSGTFEVGARAGLHYSDFNVYTTCEADPGCVVAYDTVPLPGFAIGAQVGATVGDLFFAGSLDEGFFYAVPFRTTVASDVGYHVKGPWFVDAGFQVDLRKIKVLGDTSGTEYGTLSDGETMFKLGAGWSL